MLLDEAFGVGVVGGGEDVAAGAVELGRLAGMDGFGGEVADAGVAMLGVVPGKEPPTEGTGIVQTAEAAGEIRSILERFETGLRRTDCRWRCAADCGSW